jgi:hypothetical protein
MTKEGTIIKESQLSEFLSNTGKGKNFPEGTSLRFYPETIKVVGKRGKIIEKPNDGTIQITQQIKDLNNATSVVGGKIVKMQKKRVSGRPTPTRDKTTEAPFFKKDKKGKLKQVFKKVTEPELKDMGNIGSMFGMGSQTMKKDLELLREKRKPSKERIEADRKERFRQKEKKSLKKKISSKEFSRGNIMIDYRKRKGGLFS